MTLVRWPFRRDKCSRYDIPYSAYGDGSTGYLSRTPSGGGNTKKWTYHERIKTVTDGGHQALLQAYIDDNNSTYIGITDTGQIYFYLWKVGAYAGFLQTTRVQRDDTGHIDLTVRYDSDNVTAADRMIIEVNGVRVTDFIVETYPTSGITSHINTAIIHYLGGWGVDATRYSSSYHAERLLVDGLALDSSYFGKLDFVTGNWVSKAPIVSDYGTNGFYFNSQNGANLGEDSSGKGNDFIVNGTITQSIDTPANNHNTWNPLSNSVSGSLTNGNKTLAGTSSPIQRCNSTLSIETGKYYFEARLDTAGAATSIGIGQGNLTNQYPGQDALSYGLSLENYQKINNNVQVNYGPAFGTSDIFMCAVDLDNNKIFFGHNGTWLDSSDPVAGTNPAYAIAEGLYSAMVRPFSSGAIITTRFAEDEWTYSAPTDFKSICTDNIPASLISVEDVHLTVLETGANIEAAVLTAISDAGWGTDAYRVWYKNRDSSETHYIIFSDDPTNYYSTTSLVGKYAFSGLSGSNNYVAWIERITSLYDGGTDEISHTNGAATTVTHNLGSTRVVIEMWDANNSDNRNFYHPDLTSGKLVHLNTSNNEITDGAITNITSNSFDIGSAEATGTKRWCVRAANDVRKIGTYIGNGSTNGPYINEMISLYWHLNRAINNVSYWCVRDTVRHPTNPVVSEGIFLQLTDPESTATTYYTDFLATGVKFRITTTNYNKNAYPYMYIMYGQPTVGHCNIPANGR